MRLLPYTLQGKFLAGLVVILLLLGGLFAAALRVHTQELLTSEAREKATLMMAYTEAIQKYVRSILRPSVSRIIAPDDFVIEAMSTSFVTRHILSELSIDSDSFGYRRVAKNARNPDYEVNAEESRLFGYFQENPAATRLERIEKKNGIARLVVARPVYFSPDCMRCHGDPKDAPAVLLQKYGDTRGFFRQPTELAGMDIVTVPLENTSGAIAESVTMFAIWFGSGMLLLLLTVQGFFNRLVVHNLRRVGVILQRIFFQEGDQTLLEPLQKEEEIEAMVHSIEAVATHLGAAKEQLKEHTKNLEKTVQARTADLETVLQARNADVTLFISLLSGLNHSHEKKDLLKASLELIGHHFAVDKALYACGLSGSDFFAWPPLASSAAEDEAWKSRLDGLITPTLFLQLEKPCICADYWLLPVQTSGQTRGILGLFWNEKTSPPASQIPLALAFGRQVGIALDNLEALDALLRQNTLLDCLVEGVPDPLILMDASGLPVLANSSARKLAARIRHGGEALTDVISKSCDETKQKGRLVAGERLDANLPLVGLLADMEITPVARGEILDFPIQREVTLENAMSFAIGIYPLQSGKEDRQLIIVHIRETTEEKHLLDNLRRSEKLAVVGQLAAGLTHEINNPLGVIRCYAELLSSSLEGEQEKADLEVILRHVENAQSVLRDLLDFSRPKPTSMGPCQVEPLLTSLAELFKPKAVSGKVEIKVAVKSDIPDVMADSGMLEQSLVNLIINALDAVQACCTITLGAFAEQGAGTVTLTVTDNGPGIDPGLLPKIFDPFFSTKSKGAGTGLGLPVAFGMIREMGGVMEVTNLYDGAEPAGVTFAITLPAAQGEN